MKWKDMNRGDKLASVILGIALISLLAEKAREDYLRPKVTKSTIENIAITNLTTISTTNTDQMAAMFYVTNTNTDQTYGFAPYTEPSILLSIPKENDQIKFFSSNKCFLTVYCLDGRIELSDRISTNEAAKAFWKCVSECYPHMFPANVIKEIQHGTNLPTPPTN